LDRFTLPVLISPKSPKIQDHDDTIAHDSAKSGFTSIAMEIVKAGNSVYKTERPSPRDQQKQSTFISQEDAAVSAGYNKTELIENLKKMNYARIFAA
jgi:hypothetical protein